MAIQRAKPNTTATTFCCVPYWLKPGDVKLKKRDWKGSGVRKSADGVKPSKEKQND